MTTVLDNGLTVVVQRANAAPLVSLQLRVSVGSADERADEHGAAHFLEHMVFKGSPSRGVGQMSAEIEGLGGDLNAYTTFDHTVLHATVESSSFEQALDVLADMATAPLLDPTETDHEREVVLEEIRSYDDDPGSVVGDLCMAKLFGRHPYGRPVIGNADSVRTLDADALRGFWTREWGADRALLVIAGDIAPLKVVNAVQARLGQWGAAQGQAAVPKKPITHVGWHHASGDFDTPAVEMAWVIPGARHGDLPALEVACAMLGQGAASMLNLELVLNQRVALDAGSYVQTWRNTGAFTVSLAPHPNKSIDAVDAVRYEVARLGRTPRPSDVRRARESILADAVYAAETVDGIASDLLDSVANLGDVAARDAYRGALAAVTAEDVARVVSQWLDPDRAVIACTEGASRPLTKLAVAGTTREPQRIERDDGITLLLLPDSSPVAAIRCVGLGGALNTQPVDAGIGAGWAGLLTAGAGTYDAAAFARAVEGLSGSISAVAGRNSVGLAASFPADCFDRGLDLFGVALVQPRFEDSEWVRVQQTMLEDERTVGDRPGQVMQRAVWAALYPGHPWALPMNGTPETIANLNPRRIRAWHTSQLTADNLVVAVTGGFDRDEVLETLSPWLDDLPAGPHLLIERPTPKPISSHNITLHAGNEQAWVTLAARGPDMHHPDRAAIDVATTLLGGSGGRLFLSLREAKGLAYSVWASSIPGHDGGVIHAGLATDPARTDEALAALNDELARFAQEGPTRAELRRCVRLLIGSSAMGLQRASGRAANAALGERYGTVYALDAIREELEGLTPTAVHRAWTTWMNQPVTVRVLPRQR